MGGDGGFCAGLNSDGRRVHRVPEDYLAWHRVAQYEIGQQRLSFGAERAIAASPRHVFGGLFLKLIFDQSPRFFTPILIGSIRLNDIHTFHYVEVNVRLNSIILIVKNDILKRFDRLTMAITT